MFLAEIVLTVGCLSWETMTSHKTTKWMEERYCNPADLSCYFCLKLRKTKIVKCRAFSSVVFVFLPPQGFFSYYFSASFTGIWHKSVVVFQMLNTMQRPHWPCCHNVNLKGPHFDPQRCFDNFLTVHLWLFISMFRWSNLCVHCNCCVKIPKANKQKITQWKTKKNWLV